MKQGATRAWTAVKKAAREHHESVNAAYGVHYSAGSSAASSRAPSAATTPRQSTEAAAPTVAAVQEKRKSGVWSKVKKAAREHHESVNAAYGVYYSAGSVRALSS